MASGCAHQGNDERRCIGQWFEVIAELVNAYPARTATAPSKKFEYTRTSVSRLSRDFNTIVKEGRAYSDAERASAARHVYRMQPGSAWTEADAKSLADVAASRYAEGTTQAPSAVLEMLGKMKALYEICLRHRIGISVHTPEHGLIQIDLVPQERPKLVLRPKPPKMRFSR